MRVTSILRGEFMSGDPDGFSAGPDQLTEYVGNDPLDSTDPTGRIATGVVFNPQQQGTGSTIQVGPPSNNQQQGGANSPQTNDNGKLRELVKNGIAVMQAQEKLLEKSQKEALAKVKELVGTKLSLQKIRYCAAG